MFSKYLCLILFAIFLSVEKQCIAQQSSFNIEKYKEYFEETEQDEELSSFLEILNYYYENPINLNDTNTEELSNLVLLNDFQIQALVSYIMQNGAMLSVYELQLINGFSPQTIELILPFVCVQLNASSKPFKLKHLLKYGKHSFVLGYKSLIEIQKGYEKKEGSHYFGTPFRTYFNYEYHCMDKVHFRLSADKDAGEEFFSGTQKSFDFVSSYLMLKDFSFVKRGIIGNYNLQFGQGLTLWTGFGFSIPLSGEIIKNAQGIKPAGTFSEYGYLQGIASTFKYKKIEFTPFYSHANRDASISQINERNEVIQISSILNTSYHRTQTEINNKGAVSETILGANLQYKSRYLHIGSTAYKISLSADLQPQPHLYNLHYFRGKENFNVGIDFKTLIWKVNLFGELAYSQNGAFAGIGGFQLPLSDNSSFNLAYRNYAVDYQNLYAFPIQRNSNTSNEKGVLSIFQTTLPFNIQMCASVDIFTFPWLRYLVNAPSYGEEFRVNLTRNIGKNTDVSVKYGYKNLPANTSPKNEPIQFVESNKKQSFQFNINNQVLSQLTLNSRIEYNFYNSETTAKRSGFMISQDAVFGLDNFPITLTLRYVLFDVESYDNRIYLYERDFLYEPSSVMLNNKGSRFYAMLNVKLKNRISIGLRYSIWYYNNVDFIGSGLDEIAGNTKQEIKCQLRVNF